MINSLLTAPFFALKNTGRAFSSLLSSKKEEKGIIANPSAVNKSMDDIMKRSSDIKHNNVDDDIRKKAELAEENTKKLFQENAEKKQKKERILPRDEDMTVDEMSTLTKQRNSFEKEESDMTRQAKELGIEL